MADCFGMFKLWHEFLFQYLVDMLLGLMERVDALCMDNAAIGCAMSDAPVSLGGSAICY